MSAIAEIIYREAQRLPENLARQVYDYICFIEKPVSYTHLDVYKRQVATVVAAGSGLRVGGVSSRGDENADQYLLRYYRANQVS